MGRGRGGASEGAYSCLKTAWPHLIVRQSGRVVNTSSSAGLYGNSGQSNYAAAKAALIGFAHALALEGTQYHVRVNVLLPMAFARMSVVSFDDEMKSQLRVEGIVLFALALRHSDMMGSGLVIETGGGWGAALRIERSAGITLGDNSLTLESVLSRWSESKRFDVGAEHPRSVADSLAAAVQGASSSRIS